MDQQLISNIVHHGPIKSLTLFSKDQQKSQVLFSMDQQKSLWTNGTHITSIILHGQKNAFSMLTFTNILPLKTKIHIHLRWTAVITVIIRCS